MLRPACLALLIAATTGPAAAQESPAVVAEAYAAALHEDDWATVGRLLHPAFVAAFVTSFTETDDPAVLGALPLLDSLGSANAARNWLREAAPAEAFARLAATDSQGTAAYLGFRVAAGRAYQAVRAVADGPLVLVVLRVPPLGTGPFAPEAEVVAVGRVDGAWRVWPPDRAAR